MAVLDPAGMLPFFFVLAIAYGGLEVANVVHNKGAKAVIALVVAAFAATSEPAVAFITAVMPYAAILFVGLFLISIFFSVFKTKTEEKDFKLMLVVLGLVLIFLAGSDSFRIFSLADQSFIGVIVLLVIVAILYGTTKISDK